MVTLCPRDTLIMVGAYSGRENTLTVVDVDPLFIAKIDPLSTILCRHDLLLRYGQLSRIHAFFISTSVLKSSLAGA